MILELEVCSSLPSVFPSCRKLFFLELEVCSSLPSVFPSCTDKKKCFDVLPKLSIIKFQKDGFKHFFAKMVSSNPKKHHFFFFSFQRKNLT